MGSHLAVGRMTSFPVYTEVSRGQQEEEDSIDEDKYRDEAENRGARK